MASRLGQPQSKINQIIRNSKNLQPNMEFDISAAQLVLLLIYSFNIGTVHILHHHVRGGWGVQAQIMTLMVPLGGGGGAKAK